MAHTILDRHGAPDEEEEEREKTQFPPRDFGPVELIKLQPDIQTEVKGNEISAHRQRHKPNKVPIRHIVYCSERTEECSCHQSIQAKDSVETAKTS